jgi:hypothetical protein
MFSNAFDRWLEEPRIFPSEVEDLWIKMDRGGTLWGGGQIWRFNGGLFADPFGLTLDRSQLQTLKRAALSDWAGVEPAIFGTLLERALDPKERHRLGAHYTPRAYVERLVRPTIEEPLRNEWETVRATVRVLLSAPGADTNRKTMVDARAEVARFLERLTQVRILDPACGTGNFLYVSLDVLKRLENEALEAYAQLGGATLTHHGRLVSPQQFLGIEIKRWAKEIAELVLWIGHLQWQVRTKGFEHPEEPILRDYHNIEYRDALLAYDDKLPLLDDTGAAVTHWDGVTMKRHPVTGEDVPDDTARVPEYRYVNPRKARWPEAEFIVGNPPFIGNKKMRVALGDEYVDALRAAYQDVPDTADFVMYWWDEAARLTASNAVRRFGLITTNSITQPASRRIVERRLQSGISLVFAIPDHPWSDAESGAAVRIAMTVGTSELKRGVAWRVIREDGGSADDRHVDFEIEAGIITPRLTTGIDVGQSEPLQANAQLSFMGVTLVGENFRVTLDDFGVLGLMPDSIPPFLKPYVIGRELMRTAGRRLVIDLYGLEIEAIRESSPLVYQWLHDRVRPAREQNKRESYRRKWWLFGEPRAGLRIALKGLRRYIATPETSKHRVFTFLEPDVLPDHTVFAIALEDAFSLGVLSSRVHAVWASAAGSRMGVGNDLRWRNVTCFEPFPFPASTSRIQERIGIVAETLDRHRKRRQAEHPELTLTDMYNVLEKLRARQPLKEKETVTYEQGAVSVLLELHEELNALVSHAYGWPDNLTDEEILEHLVVLNAERAQEERRGIVRWLRPEFQNQAGVSAIQQVVGDASAYAPASTHATQMPARPWPKDLPSQIAAVREIAFAGTNDSWSTDRMLRAFEGAKRRQVETVLESLSALGLLVAIGDRGERYWKAAV